MKSVLYTSKFNDHEDRSFEMLANARFMQKRFQRTLEISCVDPDEHYDETLKVTHVAKGKFKSFNTQLKNVTDFVSYARELQVAKSTFVEN